MWQASTWDPETIDKELGWAESIGFNTLRVYLHDLVWADDENGLYERMDQFLDICAKHGIRPFFVFFDDCHFPKPKLGEQPLPVRGYHNSGWVNSPAREVALRYAEGRETSEEAARLKGYVQRTISASRMMNGSFAGSFTTNRDAGPAKTETWAMPKGRNRASETSRTDCFTMPGNGPGRSLLRSPLCPPRTALSVK